ncbi:MAG: peroxide stress protein YaaA, partial [Erysipelotrichaceae bacterium]
SIEYSKVIHHEELSNYVRIEFYELRNNQYKAISTMVKVARGTMVHWLIKNKIIQKEQIKEFKELGYQLNTEKSNDQYYMFVR